MNVTVTHPMKHPSLAASSAGSPGHNCDTAVSEGFVGDFTMAFVHGGRGTRLYKIWAGMKQRCYNPNHDHYTDYGGRGIVVCDEWKSDFAAFRDWALDHGYHASLMLDRSDNDAGYSAENCRFVGWLTQNNNKRTNRTVEYRGTRYTLAELSRHSRLPYQVIVARLNAGWPVAKTAETEVATRTKRSSDFEYLGGRYSIGELATLASIPYDTLWYRLNKAGWPVERAVTTPVRAQGATV